MITYQEIRENEEVQAYLKKGNENLGVLGYTDHSAVHCTLVAEEAGRILRELGYSEHEIELAKIAGMMHDIGNCVNRFRHAEYGAILANEILRNMDLTVEDRATIVSAIGHHDESTGGAVDVVSAALIIADKTDVRRNRIRTKVKSNYDIHDRVNYAVTESKVHISKEEKSITLSLTVDEEICTMYEYFEIFLGRMMMCRGAAEMLGMTFKLRVNGSKVL